jgi:sterol desaturase/sphingolipid hydroxylase (fatty acid hydroxylase superfamily)
MNLYQSFDELIGDPSVAYIPVFGIFILWEWYFLYKQGKSDLYKKEDTIANLSLGTGSLIIGIFTKAIELIIYSYLNKFALFKIEDSIWYWWIVLIIADDFVYYWFHRFAHEVRFFWGSHSVHHSSEEYNFSVALRQTWVDPFYNFIFWVPLALIGFPAPMMLLIKEAAKIYGFYSHTTVVKKLGILEYIFCTPSHHRVHHAVNIKYLDRNHGNIFIVWDRLFGTFEEEKESPVFGLTENIKTNNLPKIVSHEYKALWKDVKKAPDLKTKLKYIFMPPGWTHNGELKTSNELRRKLNEG